MKAYKEAVAPLAGAWIETSRRYRFTEVLADVAPLAGAWIETLTLNRFLERRLPRRAPRGRVD